MTHKDILHRLKTTVEAMYTEAELDCVEVLNFELQDSGAIKLYVTVSFLGAWDIHGVIEDAREHGIRLMPSEIDTLRHGAPPTAIAKFVMELTSRLKDIGSDDGSFMADYGKALFSNPSLSNMCSAKVEKIERLIRRVLSDLTCDTGSVEASKYVFGLLSNPQLLELEVLQYAVDRGREVLGE